MARKIISSVLTFILVVTLSLGVATARSPQAAGSNAASSGSASANITIHGPGTPNNLKQYMAKFQSLIPDPGDFTPKQIRHAARQAAIGMPDVDPARIKVRVEVSCCPLTITIIISF